MTSGREEYSSESRENLAAALADSPDKIEAPEEGLVKSDFTGDGKQTHLLFFGRLTVVARVNAKTIPINTKASDMVTPSLI